MARPREHPPVLRFAAVFSAEAAALDWACARAAEHWGPVLDQSPDFPFDLTSYYRDTMGADLKKRLVAFCEPVPPESLVAAKLQSNRWEDEYRASSAGPHSRPLNIDPGYLTEAKVVLATMKDRDHRLYLGSGVFGEVTLYYRLPGQWVASRWTYPDYRLAACHEFFSACREYLRDCLRNSGGV